MKIAVSTDSNSGITRQEGVGLGVFVLPMPFMLNEDTFYEEVDLSQSEFYARLQEGVTISTSQPSPESVMRLWEELLEEYDQVVHIPMSSGLSSSYQTAVILAEEYEGRVFVVNNQRVSVTQRQSVMDAKELADRGVNGAEILQILEKVRFESSIYIMVDTLKYLKKGGRITPAAAALGTLLKLKPVLSIFGEKLDAFAKARTVKQAKSIMIETVKKELECRYPGQAMDKVHLQVAHSDCPQLAEEFQKEVKDVFGTDVFAAALPLSIACHIGPGALALAWSKKLDVMDGQALCE